MNITIRTDSSLQIGSGHLMRCLTLADELRQRGAEVTFVCREHPGNLISLIENKGFTIVKLPVPNAEYVVTPEDVAHAAWLGESWQQDASETVAALGNKRPDWFIIDHYAIDRRWEEKLRSSVGKIMVIDDLADRPHDCDLLLDQNLYKEMETRYDNLVPESCKKLLGPKYALLRPEFAAARKKLRQRDGQVRRLLVFLGGVDPTNETGKTLEALTGIPGRQFEVDVVVGAGNPNKEQIQTVCNSNAGFNYYCQVDNMAELMAAADLAIGAGGSTTWERCAVGLPTILMTLAKNQVELAACAAENALLFYVGKSETVTVKQLLDLFNVLFSASSMLNAFSKASQTFVDARGVQRIAGILIPPHIIVRPAIESDCDAIYEWRNAEETRKFIFDAEVIQLEKHRIWFQNTLANPKRILLIGEIEELPIGVLRYDFTGNQALISVYLVPGGQGQGVGTELIRCGSRWLKQNNPEIKVVNAEIIRVNIASMRAFEQAGYQEHHVIYQEEFK